MMAGEHHLGFLISWGWGRGAEDFTDNKGIGFRYRRIATISLEPYEFGIVFTQKGWYPDGNVTHAAA